MFLAKEEISFLITFFISIHILISEFIPVGGLFMTSRSSRNNQPNGYILPYANRYKKTRYASDTNMQLTDYGPYPFATNMQQTAKNNSNFRTALWTGTHLQVTLMSLLPSEDIGLEQHNDLDQLIYIEQGRGIVMMGDDPNQPNFQQTVEQGHAFVIPAGKWHNLTNISSVPLKLFSIYAPVQHPKGTIHVTKTDAEAAEEH